MARTPAEELVVRMKHEMRLAGQFRALFSRLAKPLREGLEKAPIIVNLKAIALDETRLILRQHYDLVAADFDREMTKSMEPELGILDEEAELLAEELKRIFEARAEEQAKRILNTTQKIAVASWLKAKMIIRETEGLTDLAVPRLTANIYKARARGMATGIGTLETTQAAETAKGLEVLILLHQLEDVTEIKRATEVVAIKTWLSQADDRVRRFSAKSPFDHEVPHGQEVPTDGLFVVSGELMRWPGDMSLGASIGNVINCRCSAIYDVQTVSALRTVILDELLDFELLVEEVVEEVVDPFRLTDIVIVDVIVSDLFADADEGG